MMLDTLEESPYSSYRLGVKFICVLILYIFLFYFTFINSSIGILSNFSTFRRMNVTISTVNYEITVSDPNTFYKDFNLTDRSLNTLVNWGCFINSYTSGTTDYTSLASSSSYQVYLILGLVAMGIILFT
jgi:hypothetical protein